MFFKKKIKLHYLFLTGISLILLLTIYLLGYYSIRSVRTLGEDLRTANKSFLETEFSEMISSITFGNAATFSARFKAVQDIVFLLATETTYFLKNKHIPTDPKICPSNEFQPLKGQNIKFLVTKNGPPVTIVYYGKSKTIPPQTYNAILSLMPLRYKLTDRLQKIIPIISFIGIDIGKYEFGISAGNIAEKLSVMSKKRGADFYSYGKTALSILNRKNDKKYTNIVSLQQCFWTNPYRNFVGSKPSIGVRAPVFSQAGKILGLVAIDIQLDSLVKLSLQKNFIEKNLPVAYDPKDITYNLLLSDKASVIYLSNNTVLSNILSIPKINKSDYPFFLEYESKMPNLKDSKNPNIRKIAAEISKSNMGITVIFHKGKKYVLSYCKVKTNNWTFVNIIPYDKLDSILDTTEHKTDSTIHNLTIKFIIIALTCFIGSLLLCALFFRFFIHKPIIALCNAVRKIRGGNFNHRIKKRGISELQDLANSYNTLGSSLKKYINNFETEVKKRQIFETEISIAAQIQQSVLPRVEKKFSRHEFELAAKLVPAKFIAGDFYDFFYLSETELALVIADVSGKGISSAFFMANAKAILKGVSQFSKNPAEILNKANNILSKNNESRLFVTIFYGIYNIKTGTLNYANAGHNEVILVKQDSSCKTFGSLGNSPVGFFENTQYKTDTINIDSEDTLIFYTDGITEAMQPSTKTFFGEDKLIDLAKTNHKKTSEELATIITDTIEKFQNNELFDDITILAFKRKK